MTGQTSPGSGKAAPCAGCIQDSKNAGKPPQGMCLETQANPEQQQVTKLATNSGPRIPAPPLRLSVRALWSLKALLHLGFVLPLLWLIYGVNAGLLGGDPVEYIIRFTGKTALNALLLTLMISPLAKHFRAGFLLQCRRLLGLWCFTWAVLHVLAFFSLDLLFGLSMLLREVIERPYLLVGALAFIILLLLAITSPDGVRRRLGHRWQSLHNLIYLAAPLVALHYFWSVKSAIAEPTLYWLLVLVLLWFRRGKLVLYWQKRRAAGVKRGA